MKKYYNSGFCPACESDNVSYGKVYAEDVQGEEGLTKEVICEDCKTSFKEWYYLTFFISEITGKEVPEEEL
jgi:hypothetical protein